MTHDTDSFVQEVNEGLREDRMLTAAKRYGPWLIGVFAVFILGLVGWQFWQGQTQAAGRAQADAYTAAQQLAQSGDLDGAKAAFERLTGEGPQAYRVMARMEHAAILQVQGDLEGALNEFDQAAEDARDPVMRQSAQMRAAYIAAETQDFDALRTRLQPLVDADTRFAFLARELLAFEAWEAGDLELARDTLENLTLAFDAPDAVRQRAQIALSVVGPAAPAAAATPAPAEGDTQ